MSLALARLDISCCKYEGHSNINSNTGIILKKNPPRLTLYKPSVVSWLVQMGSHTSGRRPMLPVTSLLRMTIPPTLLLL